MTIEYKGNKWDKEVLQYQKMIEQTKAINKNELFTINKFTKDGSKDFLRLYSRLAGNYERMAAYHYLNDIHSKDVIKYTYLSGYSMLIAKWLYDKGIGTKYNEIIENIVQNENIDFALYQLIASEGVEDNPYIADHENNIIMLMYTGRYGQVEEILNKLTDTPDETKEFYYTKLEYLKNIYWAILEHNEEKFNQELTRRIKKYRKNMVGYSIIVDVVSVALIKLAERAGIYCTIDVIEIPKQFFDSAVVIDRSKDTLPFFDEFLKFRFQN